MGIDQEADRLVRHSTDFRQQALGHGGIGQAIDHDHIPVANDDAGAAVTDQGRLQEGVDVFGKFTGTQACFTALSQVSFWLPGPMIRQPWSNLKGRGCSEPVQLGINPAFT